MIIFDQVTKTYPTGDTVIENVSFQVDPQDLVVIEGPSGSGKTTLFRLIYKDLEPSSGTITVDGEDISKISKKNLPLYRRKIGFAFQDFKIIPDKTIWENLSLPLEILNFSDSLIQERLDHLFELIGLTSKAELFPRQLSGGELQRVSIARAMATEPSILLADEPTGNLDFHTAANIIKLLKEINKLGTTVLLASHDHELTKDLHARHFHFEDGKLVDKSPHHKAKKEEHPKTEPKETKKEE